MTYESLLWSYWMMVGLFCVNTVFTLLMLWAFRTSNRNYQQEVKEWKEEALRLREGRFTPEELQNLCHNLSQKDEEAFKLGCLAEWRRLFGNERYPMGPFPPVPDVPDPSTPQPHQDSAGQPLKVGDKVRWRGAIYTVKRFRPNMKARGVAAIEFEEPRHSQEVPDEMSVDKVEASP